MDASVSYTDSNGNNVTDLLKTYSAEEQETHRINASNAKAVFSPKFIPFYPQLVKAGYTVNDAVIYGFIDFYTSNASSRFYFTNEQISSVVGCSVPTVSRSLKKLEKNGLLTIRRKMRADGGQIRFVKPLQIPTNQNDSTLLIKMISCNSSKRLVNNNKINKNKTNINKQPNGLKDKNYKVSEWQGIADYWKDKLSIKEKDTASFYRMFKQSLAVSESAARFTVESNPQDNFKYFCKLVSEFKQ